jgi:hypothetical protein
MALNQADARILASLRRGGVAPGPQLRLACEPLQSGFQLDTRRMFAALFPITLAGVAPFVFMIALSKLALGQ